ncbi:MAG: glycerate kinase, partial [Acidimicrobiia bacterium]|nr:glycerate kinase [Acidimicrobiia bacterium]
MSREYPNRRLSQGTPTTNHRRQTGNVRVLAAVDKFKGTASAADVARAIGHACWELGFECDELAMADGGEGTLDAL